MGENGEVSEGYSPGPDGTPVWGPMKAPDNWRPPCKVCPKVADREVKAPLQPEEDFGPWFWELKRWYERCRAVGDFGSPSPAMLDVAREFDLADRRLSRRALANAVALGVAGAVRRK